MASNQVFFSCSLEHWGGRQQRGLQFQFDKKTNLTLLSENFFIYQQFGSKKMTHLTQQSMKKFRKPGEKLYALPQKWI